MDKLHKNIILTLDSVESEAGITIRSTDSKEVVVISIGSDRISIELELLSKTIEEINKFHKLME